MRTRLHKLRTMFGVARSSPAATGAETVRPPGPLVWLHASQASDVGPMQSLAAALIEAHGGLTALITSDDPDQAAASLPGCLWQPSPGHANGDAATFFRTWRPDMAVLTTGELPETLIVQARRQPVPVYLICTSNEPISRRLLRGISRVFATSPESLQQMKKRGLADDRIDIVGELREHHEPLDHSVTERENLAQLLAGRPCWLAAETSAAEDLIVVAAQATATRFSHRLLLILVPDNPERGSALAQDLKTGGWRVALRSEKHPPEEETQILIADLADEMGLWFRLSPVSFLGGSLDPSAAGSIDPAGPAALGSAILHGPNGGAHAAQLDRLDAANAARMVRDADTLARVLTLLIAPDAAAELAHNAWEVSTEAAETTNRIVARLIAALDGDVAA